MAEDGVTSMPIRDVATVLVHHKNEAGLRAVVEGLLAEGLSPQKFVIVDNSEDELVATALRREIGGLARLLFTKNRGYGAAVNAGIESLRESSVAFEKLLVATHEVRVTQGCVRTLAAHLEAHASVGAIGPLLMTSVRGEESVWSGGGTLGRYTRLPTHLGAPLEKELRRVLWLDGALVMYRCAALPEKPFDESFFLYMEEVDLHLRLTESGWDVTLAPDCRAWQSSSGTPPFFYGRNIRILATKHSLIIPRRSVAIGIGKTALGIARRRQWGRLRELSKGATSAAQARAAIVIVNPLGAALSHYSRALSETLGDIGVEVRTLNINEPSAGNGRIRWARDYLRALRSARRAAGRSGTVVSTWPAFGYIDLVMMKLLTRRGTLIVHDPSPLVRSIGLGAVGQRFGRLMGRGIEVLTHSEQAARDVKTALRLEPQILPHPIRVTRSSKKEGGDRRRLPRIAVLGQYKRDRDLALLARLARFYDGRAELKITGRGWPSVEGWSVDPRYLSEREFDDVLRRSDVVLIPYKRFFQSGVAIRSLENGTPVVGPRGTVLDELLGKSSPLLTGTDDAEWTEAISYALAISGRDLDDLVANYQEHVVRAWRGFLPSIGQHAR